MKIIPYDGQIGVDNFCAEVKDVDGEKCLMLPSRVFDLIDRNIKAALDFLCWMQFPSNRQSIADGLNWKSEDVDRAIEGLMNKLENHIDHNILCPESEGRPSQFVNGAGNSVKWQGEIPRSP